MKARVVSTDTIAKVGDVIEVLGFVHIAGKTCAVWRDERGWVYTIPISAIRMEPHIADEVAAWPVRISVTARTKA